MASRLRAALLVISIVGFANSARAEGLDAKGDAMAREATRLYKQGSYEDAAKIFAQLSVDYPDMTVFERNVGACFYYLHRPEPALSNLRNYLNHAKNIDPGDKAVVDRWIAEMEQLQAQNVAASVAPAAPVPAPVPAPTSPPVPEPQPSLAQPAAPTAPTQQTYPPPSPPQTSPTWFSNGVQVPAPAVQQPVAPAPATATPAPDTATPAPAPAPTQYFSPTAAPVPTAQYTPVAQDTQRREVSPVWRIAGGMLVGTGVVLMGVGGYYSWKTKDRESSINDSSEFDSTKYNEGKSAEKLQWVFYGIGGVLAAGGLVVIIAAPERPSRVSLVPQLGPGLAGLGAQGTF